MPCVYPGPHSTKMSKEHFLPAGLGEYTGCPLLLDKLCEACNNHLGNTLETQFLRVGPIGLMRWIVGLRGRKGNSPSPFLRGAAKTKAVVSIGRVRGFDFDIALEADPGTQNVGPMRQIIMLHPILGHRAFPIFDGTTKDSFLAQLEEEGFRTAKPVHAFAHMSERAWIDELASCVGTKTAPDWSRTPMTNETVEVITTVTATPSLYYREIAKIAFHYMLSVAPSINGDESEFEHIRNYIWTGLGDRPVVDNGEQIFANFVQGYRPTHWSHFLYMIRESGVIVVYVQLFAGPQSLPLPYRVNIGLDPRRILAPPERVGHQFVILRPDAADNVVGEMVDAELLQKIIPVFRRSNLLI